MAIHFLKRHWRIVCRCFVFCSISAFLLCGCSTVEAPPTPPGHPKPYKVGRTWYKPLPHAQSFSQRGKASWYGTKFHGRKTANGEIYNMYAMTAAHKTLPLGTYVKVHHLANNRSVEVRINDRGPFVRGRIIDLSYSAAKDLGIVGPGTANVEVVALGTPATTDGGTARSYVPGDYYSGNFTFQVGAFLNYDNAKRLKHKLDEQYKNAHITIYDNGKDIYYRVRVGKATNLEQAAEFETYLIQNGFPDAFAVAE